MSKITMPPLPSDVFRLVSRTAFASGDSFNLADQTSTHIALRNSFELKRVKPVHFQVDEQVENVDLEISTRFEKFPMTRTGAEFAVVMPSGRVLTSGFFVADQFNQLLSDSIRAYGMLARFGFHELPNRAFRLALADYRFPSIKGICLPIGAQTNRNYFHWLYESLPRILTGRKLLSGEMKILVPEMTPWMKDCLSVLDIREENVHTIEDDIYTCETLVFAARGLSNIHTFGAHALDLIDILLEKAVSVRPPIDAKRLFISRESAANRKIANEGSIISLAGRYGFVAVHPEHFSLLEQVALFRNADFVVGALGAGLTNVSFMLTGGRLLELAPEGRDGDAVLFANLCQLRGLDYGLIVGPHVPDQTRAVHLRDFWIDEARFDAAMKAMT